MKKILLAASLLVIWSLQVFAVTPPTAKQRDESEKRSKEKCVWCDKKKSDKGCQYGVDKTTGKCYKPKEGQFYKDKKTGDVEVKGVTNWNMPWSDHKKKPSKK